MNKTVCILLAYAALLVSSEAQSTNTPIPVSQQEQKFERVITKELVANHLLFLPKDYEAKGDKKWPLILFLHGSGECGTNLQKVAVHGIPKIVKNKPEFPFIAVSPQCPEGEWWSDEVLLALLDHVTATYAVDTNRIYLTGLSMGGYGTWSLGIHHPERFAAIAPICGGGVTIDIFEKVDQGGGKDLKALGVWAFHGAKDDCVDVNESERMIKALKAVGCQDVNLTIYPDAGHDSWTKTYDNPALYEWFLKHSRALKQ